MPKKTKKNKKKSDKTFQTHVRSARDIKQSLLKKAISEGRGHEMIKLILWRLAQIKHFAAQDKEAIREALYMDDQPQSIRALNTLAYHKNIATRFSLRDEDVAQGIVHEAPEYVH